MTLVSARRSMPSRARPHHIPRPALDAPRSHLVPGQRPLHQQPGFPLDQRNYISLPRREPHEQQAALHVGHRRGQQRWLAGHHGPEIDLLE